MRILIVLATALLLTGLCPSSLSAQEPLAIRIHALSSAERDAITADLATSGELHVIYACVPAGLIAFSEGTPSGSRAALRSKVVSAVANRISQERIDEKDISLEAAENACENARGR